MATFKNVWLEKLEKFFNHLLFVLYTAILTYANGPYYAMMEFFRNLQIFGFKKLDYENEFKGLNLSGKICVITGGTRGIGLETVKYLLLKNCTVITGSSKLSKNISTNEMEIFKKKILSKINQDNNEKITERFQLFPLNLSDMDSVIEFCQKIKNLKINNIDLLICNGGVMFVPFSLCHEQMERHMAINYYSHCLMIMKLLPLMSMANGQTGNRIIMVSSGLHHASFGLRLHDLNSHQQFSCYHSYAQSKLSEIMFCYRFNDWIKNNPFGNGIVTINSLHPGICRTDLMVEGFRFFRFKPLQSSPLFRAASEGAETILFTALSPKMENVSGKYLEDCLPQKSSPISYDIDLQRQLWIKTWNDLKPWLTNDEYNLVSKKF